MAEPTVTTSLEPPRVYLVHMMVFTLAVTILVLVLLPGLTAAFMANAGLNGVIIGALVLGMFHSYRMVWRLFPEVRWINSFRDSEADADMMRQPRLLGPMASLLRNRQSMVLSPMSMRSLLDSLASRLDESRDMSRYLVSLLIFLGLLGTFWGLLETVTSIGSAINALDVTSGQSSTVFEGLKEGLKGPLTGMGLSFSASMFGLAGSLILGFLDLKASQAQNRFYNDLEDWLSTITDIAAGDGAPQPAMPPFIGLDLQSLQRSIEKLSGAMEQSKAPAPESMEQLAEAVAGLVTQMREEQKMVRQWTQTQQVQQNEIQRLLIRASGPPQRGSARARVDEE
ncbi:MAG: MotA/TolQ/ExbB proton channel family protein [Rhizobiales bacterium]|nr:MotA/TolQ/ExbB proton channel family protein [Hyphomicrobiales bacterium]